MKIQTLFRRLFLNDTIILLLVLSILTSAIFGNDLISTRASEGMSFINSIFVDAAVSDNNDEVMKKLDRIEKLLETERDDCNK